MRNRKTGQPYPPRKTACVCSRLGVKQISGGWICAECLRIDAINGGSTKVRIKKRGRPELWKYADSFSHTLGGVQ